MGDRHWDFHWRNIKTGHLLSFQSGDNNWVIILGSNLVNQGDFLRSLVVLVFCLEGDKQERRKKSGYSIELITQTLGSPRSDP